MKDQTRKLLWGNSKNMCAFPDCDRKLIVKDEKGRLLVLGEEAHIISKKEDGPRGRYRETGMDFDSYDNLILLCPDHHREIDTFQDNFSPTRLKEMKKAHELKVSNNIELPNSDAINFFYSSYIDSLEDYLDLDECQSWIAGLRHPAYPQISKLRYQKLREFITYSVKRPWPEKIIQFEQSAFNLINVLNDLVNVFESHMEEIFNRPDYYRFARYYEKIRDDKYSEKKSVEHDGYIALINELAVELTRALHHFFETVRNYFDPFYRLEEGNMIISVGPDKDLNIYQVVFTYSNSPGHSFPYPGLGIFKQNIIIQ